MISYAKLGLQDITPVYEIYGLSDDTKPSDVPNGSKYTAIDTACVYLYDAENGTWYLFSGTEPEP